MNLLAASLPFVLAGSTLAQSPQPENASRIQREFILGERLSEDLERRDGRITDPALTSYVQGIANRVARALGKRGAEVRLTRASDLYAQLQLQGVLYISGAFLERIENEAELAGLLAHELGHLDQPANLAPRATISVLLPKCALGSRLLPSSEGQREREQDATRIALEALRRAGYDPTAVLDLLSKVAYEHPSWAKSIVPDDLLNLRTAVGDDVATAAGYVIDSSEFAEQHFRLLVLLGHAPRSKRVPSLRSASPQ